MYLLVIARRILKLFVDDTAFAAAIVAWIAVAGVLAPRLPHGTQCGAPAFFGGLALILLIGASCFAAAKRFKQ